MKPTKFGLNEELSAVESDDERSDQALLSAMAVQQEDLVKEAAIRAAADESDNSSAESAASIVPLVVQRHVSFEENLFKSTASLLPPAPPAANLRPDEEQRAVEANQNPRGSIIGFQVPLPVMIGDGVEKIHIEKENTSMEFCGLILTMLSYFIMGATFPFSLFFCLKVVQEYERAVIFRLGRLIGGGARGPGIFFLLPCIERYSKVDLRTISFDVPPQEVLTKDSVTVSVDAVVYYRVSNATVSVANVENAHHSTRLLAQTTLRNVLGTKSLSEILSERESISNSMQEILATATYPWGICVERVEIKDVRLPVQLQRAMAAEAEAAREAGAKVIAAEGEQKASRALKEASDVISQSPTALQLRYLQTLTSISAEKTSTIIFPVPIDFMSHFMQPHKEN